MNVYLKKQTLCKWFRYSDTITAYSDGPQVDNVDEILKCYMHCIFVQAEVYHDNGSLNLPLLYEKLPASMKYVGLKMGSQCLVPVGDTACERAFWYNKCWKSKDPVVIFFQFSAAVCYSRLALSCSTISLYSAHRYLGFNSCNIIFGLKSTSCLQYLKIQWCHFGFKKLLRRKNS